MNMKKRFFRFTRKRGIPDSMAVLPKIRRMHCKRMISFLSEGSPRRLGLTQSSNAWNLGTRFTAVRETFTGFPKVGSVMSEEFKSKLRRADERICPKVFSSFGPSYKERTQLSLLAYSRHNVRQQHRFQRRCKFTSSDDDARSTAACCCVNSFILLAHLVYKRLFNSTAP